MSKLDELVSEIRAIWDGAEAEGRDATRSERAEVERLLKAVDTEKINQRIKALGGGAPDISGLSDHHGMTPGEAFTMSDGFKAVQDGAMRGRQWTTGEIDVGMPGAWGFGLKGTLLEGSGSPGSGTGGGWVPSPQVVNGMVQTLFRPTVLEDLLQSGQATTSTVRYATQGTATSAAAGVLEGGNKPESTMAFSTVDEQIKKIATTLTISDELLEDATGVQTFVNSQLGTFVNLEVERQLLRGTAGGAEIQGLLTSRSVPVFTAGTALGNMGEQLFKAANSMRGSAYLEPDWYVVSTTDYQSLRLMKDTAGQFFGGGPFMGPYGNGNDLAASGQLTGAVDQLWGKPCYISPLIGAGTALVGTVQGAQVWNRGGLRVEATNSHASYFTSDLVAIRAERRMALAVYRSNGYVEVRGLA